MSPLRAAVLERLAEGGMQSGEALAEALGVSRAAIAKHVAGLRAMGWPVEARRGSGYRLPPADRPLERPILEAALGACAARVEALGLFDRLDSTSRELERGPGPSPGRVRLCIAECQYAGQGRRGRAWHAVPGGSITFSAQRDVGRPPAELGALGLAVGIGLAEALAGLGIHGVRLKWPNDLVHGGRKLGGVLLGFRGEAAGATRVTVGVGINHAEPDAGAETAATGLRALVADPPGRSHAAGTLMAATVAVLDEFERDGFAGFHRRWHGFDVLADRPVRVWTDRGCFDGVARGIGPDGALIFEDATGERRPFHGGDVSIRTRT